MMIVSPIAGIVWREGLDDPDAIMVRILQRFTIPQLMQLQATVMFGFLLIFVSVLPW